MAKTYYLEASYLHSVTRRIFTAAGAPRHIADNVAEILVNANLAGHDSHGVLRIPAYLRGIESGRMNPAVEPEVVRETANTMLFDGKHCFGHYTARQAMKRTIEKAKAADVCSASLINTGHIGRLGQYAEEAARAGC
ncbi:MAG: Ldh family oxidoreductase, partial [Candidatus Poribacteria bacterium]|nr:Ldh family oxidoreductase [Candidatus Poribacteria bacterium]